MSASSCSASSRTSPPGLRFCRRFLEVSDAGPNPSQQAEKSVHGATMGDVQLLLRQISEANNNLQSRLEQPRKGWRAKRRNLVLPHRSADRRFDGLSNRRAPSIRKLDEFFARWASTKKLFVLHCWISISSKKITTPMDTQRVTPCCAILRLNCDCSRAKESFRWLVMEAKSLQS